MSSTEKRSGFSSFSSFYPWNVKRNWWSPFNILDIVEQLDRRNVRIITVFPLLPDWNQRYGCQNLTLIQQLTVEVTSLGGFWERPHKHRIPDFDTNFFTVSSGFFIKPWTLIDFYAAKTGICVYNCYPKRWLKSETQVRSFVHSDYS